jgi:hypothetical protein
MKAECKNSICMWFKKLNLITDFKSDKTDAVEILLKDGRKVKGLSGSNQFRQYFESSDNNKGYLCLKTLKVIWQINSNKKAA